MAHATTRRAMILRRIKVHSAHYEIIKQYEHRDHIENESAAWRRVITAGVKALGLEKQQQEK